MMMATGCKTPAEPGIPSVSVVITDALGVTRTVTTDASGVYTATNVPSGTAVVDVVNSTLPAGYVDTTLADPSNVTVVPGVVNNAGKDGYQPRGTVVGTVFRDDDGDGVQNGAEPGIPSVSVVITDALGVTRTVTTDASGVYTATNVPSGTAMVDVVNSTLPAGYVDTTLADPSNVTVSPGVVNNAGKDGYQPRAAVYGHLFVDMDGDAIQDAGEPNLPNVSVVITDVPGCDADGDIGREWQLHRDGAGGQHDGGCGEAARCRRAMWTRRRRTRRR